VGINTTEKKISYLNYTKMLAQLQLSRNVPWKNLVFSNVFNLLVKATRLKLIAALERKPAQAAYCGGCHGRGLGGLETPPANSYILEKVSFCNSYILGEGGRLII